MCKPLTYTVQSGRLLLAFAGQCCLLVQNIRLDDVITQDTTRILTAMETSNPTNHNDL